MAAAVLTVTKPSSVKGEWKVGNRAFKIRDITIDTGNYSTGGFTLTPSQFGLKKVDFAIPGGPATSGTSQATATPVALTINSTGTSLTLQIYEVGGTGAAGDPLREKDDAEAVLSNWTVRVLVAGQ